MELVFAWLSTRIRRLVYSWHSKHLFLLTWLSLSGAIEYSFRNVLMTDERLLGAFHRVALFFGSFQRKNKNYIYFPWKSIRKFFNWFLAWNVPMSHKRLHGGGGFNNIKFEKLPNYAIFHIKYFTNCHKSIQIKSCLNWFELEHTWIC